MKVVALIPARYDSERFPGKLLKKIGPHSVIFHTYKSAVSTGLFDEVIVVTDSDKIYKEIKNNKGKVVRSYLSHQSGTDRIAEVIDKIDADIIVNIQGDEPFVNKKQIDQLINTFKQDDAREVDITSLMIKIFRYEDFTNSNNVKVVVDQNSFALYFSRAPIPYPRDGKFEYAYKHIGVYAFRKEVLKEISKLPVSRLEKIERLENLRFLENGYKIKLQLTDQVNIGIDTPDDLKIAQDFFKNNLR